MMKALLLARVSSKEQEEGQSIPAQNLKVVFTNDALSSKAP